MSRVGELIKRYKNEISEIYDNTDNRLEKEELEVLSIALDDVNFLIKCMVEDFPIEYAPRLVYLFDTEVHSFLLKDGQGYTRDIYNACIYNIDLAKQYIKTRKNTKIVYFGE